MKFKKLMKKYNLVAGFVVLGLASCLAIVGISCSNEEYKKEEIKQEQQVPTPEYVSPIKPQKPESTPAPKEEQMSDIDMALSLMEPSIRETLGDMEYEFLENGNQLALVMHFPAEDLPYVTEKDWSDLKASAIYAQSGWQDVFDQAGLNVQFCVFIGDIDKDRMYLAAVNGYIVYDVFEESSGNNNELKIREF